MFILTPVVAALFVSTIVNAIVAYIGWQKKTTQAGKYFALGMMALTFWTLTAGLDYAVVPLSYKIFFAKFEALGYFGAILLFTLASIFFAGNDVWLEKRWFKALLFLPPAINILLVWTNELHGMIWTSFESKPNNIVVFNYGSLFKWVMISTYLSIALIFLNLWVTIRKGSPLARKQALGLVFALLIPIISNTIYQFGIGGVEGVDWTSVTFSISGVVFLYTLYGARFLDLIPIARDKLFDNLADGMIVLDIQNRIVDINQPAIFALGAPLASLIGKKLSGINPVFYALLEQNVEGEIQSEIELGGEINLWFEAHILPLREKRKALIGRLVVLRDITRRKQAESALREAQSAIVAREQAMSAERERQYLARDLHDGIAQSLGYIGGQVERARQMLEEKNYKGAEETMSNLAHTTQQANRDARQYILTLKEGAQPLVQEEFFLTLQEYCRSVEHAHRFGINLFLPQSLPDVLASAQVETQLTYIIREALQNARKHSGASQANLKIEVEEKFVQAVVEDFGTGWSGEENQKNGHFGLSVMRARAEQVGGSLQIESSPANGTRVTVRLPRKLAEENLSRLHILLVDDHPLVAEGVKSTLASRGANVVGVAKDGEEAQEMALALKPDLILMDINMPQVNGLDAIRNIKIKMPDTKIIMLTSSINEDDFFAALHAGAAGYLLKGMNADEFITLLAETAYGAENFSSDVAAKMLKIFTRPELQLSPTQPHNSLALLTETQQNILRLVAQGLTYKDVGKRIFITERTVKYHMGEILQRLHLKGRRELVKYMKDQEKIN